MISDEKSFLRCMGYDVEKEGALFFFDLLEDVRSMLKEGMSAEEIKKELPKYYIDYAHFDYEIGQNLYQQYLREFCSSRKVDENNFRINQEVLKDQENMGIEETLLFFGQFFNNQELKSNSNNNSGIK